MRANRFALLGIWLTAGLMIGALALAAVAKEPADGKQPTAKSATASPQVETAPDGRELFTREWVPGDSRAHGGDGLGPVYNESSCVACHNQGGIGGGGPSGKNADIITAFTVPVIRSPGQRGEIPETLFDSVFGGLAPRPAPAPPTTVGPVKVAAAASQQASHAKAPAPMKAPTAAQLKRTKEREKAALVKVHPGFATARSVVLHRFGTDPKYAAWRAKITTGAFFPVPSEVETSEIDSVQVKTVTESSSPPALTETPAEDDDPTVHSAVAFSSGSAEFAPAASLPEMNQLVQEVQLKTNNFSTTQVGNIQLSHSQRNPTALFGIGQIDAIPVAAIEEMAKIEREKYPTSAGRPSKQKDGKIGRFGWKAQKSSLEDFALTACAVELGLNVPDHEQAGVPLNPKYKAPGLDMNRAECDALVKFLRDLPTPTQCIPASSPEAANIEAGHKQFAAIGCAACHAQKLGSVDGIYSDLLLHDMGPALGDTGAYGVFTPNSPEEEQQEPLPMAGTTPANPFSPQPQPALTPAQLAKVIGALRQEWRTPPLWGVRDSGPYLHDGRADTLEQAIALHGGQGSGAAVRFFQLKPAERQQLLAFLKSLTAPEPAVAMK